MAFSVNLGPCSACNKTPADLNVGSKTCQGCGTTFEQMCLRCAGKPCPRCKGTLTSTTDVFPHSLFRAIKTETVEDVRRVLAGRPERLDKIKDRNGETALSVAARQKPAGRAHKTCAVLIELGASPHAKSDRTERTALVNAVFHRQFSKNVARLLVDSINDQDVDGCTALMHAARGAGLFRSQQGNLSIVGDLLSLGAGPFIRDKRGRTALDHAHNNEVRDRLKRAMKRT